jgi:hydroxymethylpyrimidine pyrophosphatase-like HAD family hydrolase
MLIKSRKGELSLYKYLGIILSITLISNQNIYLNNNSLNTSTIFQQERILTNIFANFTRSQKKEMLAFDIDGTLLNGTETLSENHPQTLTQLVNLLKSGANIIFITLSDYEQKHNRSTITPILNYLKSQNLTHLMKNITIYARSGAIKYTFTETGQEISEILDYDFSLIDAGIIQDIIKKLAKHKFNLTKKEQELWIRYYSNPIEGKKYNALC